MTLVLPVLPWLTYSQPQLTHSQLHQRIATGIEKLWGVKHFHLSGVIRLLNYILLINEQISWVSNLWVLKNYFVKCFGATNFHIGIINIFKEFITLLRLNNFVDMMQSMNAIVCWYNFCLENSMTKKNCNIMILDNSGIDYTWMLLIVFGFLVYLKISPNSGEFPRLWQHLTALVYYVITKRSRQCCQKKLCVRENNF